MKPRTLIVAIIAVIAVALAVRDVTRRSDEELPWLPNDKALYGRTGRPQLVEFFHPT
jgi:hypothetical protein